MKTLTILALLIGSCASGETQAWDDSMQSVTLGVQGMSCPNCVNNVTHTLYALPGVDMVSINMGEGTVTIGARFALPPQADLEQAIRDAGFTPGPNPG